MLLRVASTSFNFFLNAMPQVNFRIVSDYKQKHYIIKAYSVYDYLRNHANLTLHHTRPIAKKYC